MDEVMPRRAPVPIVGGLLAPLYAGAVAWRNRGFDRRGGARVRGERGEIPVISVGNLSVGGTGKTPLVMHVVRVLQGAGRRPCVTMRGYGGRGSGVGRSGVPDEADSYARALPGVPVIARRDRAAALAEYLALTPGGEQPDVIVLDDGFQHRQLARDLDVVVIDATPGRSVFTDRVLPAGWLREPAASLARAGAVVLTHAEMASGEQIADLRRRVGKVTKVPIAVTRHVWTTLHQRRGAADVEISVTALAGARVVGCCAIGNPEGFGRGLAAAVGGTGACRVLEFPDHDALGASRVRAIAAAARAERAEMIVVTDKDWSKLRRVPDEAWPCAVVRAGLAIEFVEGEGGLNGLVVGAANRAGGLGEERGRR